MPNGGGGHPGDPGIHTLTRYPELWIAVRKVSEVLSWLGKKYEAEALKLFADALEQNMLKTLADLDDWIKGIEDRPTAKLETDIKRFRSSKDHWQWMWADLQRTYHDEKHGAAFTHCKDEECEEAQAVLEAHERKIRKR